MARLVAVAALGCHSQRHRLVHLYLACTCFTGAPLLWLDLRLNESCRPMGLLVEEVSVGRSLSSISYWRPEDEPCI